METDTLGKKVVAELLKDAPPLLGDVLSLRQSLAKSSVKKYTAMENAACSDSRARGMFQFYGANRTGRWAGRLIQMQNLPQNHLPDIEQARALVRSSNFAALELLYDSVPEVLSELIRTAFIPKDGNKLIIADFSAIEARVIAWFAGESWRNEVFAGHGRIYEASASQMFNVPIEEITKGSPLRQKGKIAELALGYGGSVGALKAMGALDMGLYEDELQSLVNAWRSANPNIVRFWWAVDRAAMTAVKDRTVTETHGIRFSYQSGMLFITLPSGRRLAYVKPRIGENQFGSPCVTYEGVGGTKKTWTTDEVQQLLSAIDRTGGVGKRDYAMILLAVILGMRVGDINALMFENLDWNRKLITYVQQKTSKTNTLPLLPEIGEAIIDYLKNGRLESDSKNVFIRHIPPYSGLGSSSALSCNIKRYMRMADLKVKDRKAAHSLRHTLASSLLSSGTPLMTISNILGHYNPRATVGYTKVDVPSLRKCSLSYGAKAVTQ